MPCTVQTDNHHQDRGTAQKPLGSWAWLSGVRECLLRFPLLDVLFRQIHLDDMQTGRSVRTGREKKMSPQSICMGLYII